MTYSTNSTINDMVLTIINDGNGSQCGMNYKKRCAAAEHGLAEFRVACQRYGTYRLREYGAKRPTHWEIFEAADILQAYYREHIKELQS